MYTEIKSHPIRAPGRLLGGDVREACEEKREKARGREWIDSGAVFSMRYYAAAVLYNVVEKHGRIRRCRCPFLRRWRCRRSEIYCSFTLRAHIERTCLQLRPAKPHVRRCKNQSEHKREFRSLFYRERLKIYRFAIYFNSYKFIIYQCICMKRNKIHLICLVAFK